MKTTDTVEALAALWPEGKNVLRYDRELSTLTDLHAPVAVGTWNTDQMGVTQLFLQGWAPTAESPVFDPLLRLFVQTGAAWEPVPVVERTCWPGGWVEEGYTQDLAVRQWVWFASPGELAIRWSLEPTRGEPLEVRLALGGGHTRSPLILNGQDAEDALAIGAATAQTDSDGETVMEATFALRPWTRPERCRFRTAPSQNDTAPGDDELAEAVAPAKHFGYWMELAPLQATGGQALETGATLSWTFMGTTYPEPETRQTFLEAVERQRSIFTPAAPDASVSAYWQRKGILAASGLVGSLIQAPGYGNMETKLSLGARTLGHLSNSYFWDTMSAVPALAVLDEGWAAEVVENFTQYEGVHDCPPFAISAFPRLKGKRRSWHGSQAPIASWAAMKLATCTGRDALAKRLYPGLKWINDSWFEHADLNRDGVPEWMNSGAVADNSPLYDRYAIGGDWTNIYLPPIASTCLCSYLLMDLRCLAEIARRLGKDDEASAWTQRRATLEAKTLEMLWHAEERIFYDLDLTVYEPNRVKTFFSLLPLWAGIDLPEADARAAIEAHLLNPGQMWGAVPFPSVAYSEPAYEPTGYWRGRSWPHIYFWNTEILARYGYAAEADEAKRRFLAVMADGVDIPENIVTDIAHPARHEQGLPHYSWGLAITLYFLWDWHKQPV